MCVKNLSYLIGNANDTDVEFVEFLKCKIHRLDICLTNVFAAITNTHETSKQIQSIEKEKKRES